jgi:hypothetical protein
MDKCSNGQGTMVLWSILAHIKSGTWVVSSDSWLANCKFFFLKIQELEDGAAGSLPVLS